MSLYIYATRTELGLGTLELTTPTPGPPSRHLTPESLREVTRTWRKQQVTSPEVEGAYTTWAVRDIAHHRVEILHWAATHAALGTMVAETVRCFEQWSWELHIQEGGVDYVAWRCGQSDVSTGMDEPWHFGRIQVVTFTLERQPVPLVGPY